jgi:CHAT domain-containing protein
MATLWQVDDEATTVLVSAFYRHLHDDLERGQPITKSEALRRAQIDVMTRQPGKQHPYFWAPYLVIGNWL